MARGHVGDTADHGGGDVNGDNSDNDGKTGKDHGGDDYRNDGGTMEAPTLAIWKAVGGLPWN